MVLVDGGGQLLRLHVDEDAVQHATDLVRDAHLILPVRRGRTHLTLRVAASTSAPPRALPRREQRLCGRRDGRRLTSDSGDSSARRSSGAARARSGGLASPAPALASGARLARRRATSAGRGGRGALGGLLAQRSRARSSSSSSIASGRAVIAQQTEGSSPLAACALRRTYGVPADGWFTDHAGTAKLSFPYTAH